MLNSFASPVKRVEPAWEDWREWFSADARRQHGDSPEAVLRYLPAEKLACWDLRYEHGLEQLLYIQNLIEED